ncbi:MAG: hypothetical protein ACR2KN_05725, partial [Geodermatophilaceae bacterium]
MHRTVRRAALAIGLAGALMGSVVSPAAAAPAASTGLAAGTLAGLNMERVTIPQLQAAMNNGSLTSVALTNYYLDRINRVDPVVNAVL